MDSQRVLLTAKVFSEAVLEYLNMLYRRVILCDVTLVAQNSVVFPAHKVVLVSSSGYFRSLLDEGHLLDEDRHLLTGMPASQLKILLDFMYTGSLHLTECNIGLIQKAAEQLKIEEAVKLCKEYTANLGQGQREVKSEVDEETWLLRFQRRPDNDDTNDETMTQMTFHSDLHSGHNGSRHGNHHKHSKHHSYVVEDGIRNTDQRRDPDVTDPDITDPDVTDDASLDESVVTGMDQDIRAPYICDICEKSYQSRDGLRRHKRVHSNDYPFRCKECRKGFHYENALQDHMRTAHRKDAMKCALCSCCVHTVAGWKLHASLHASNESFPCDKCCKTFPNKVYLNRHKKTHARSYECPTCSKNFTTKQHLKVHARLHQPDFSLHCDLCSFVTKHKASLVRHKNTAHSAEAARHTCKCGVSFKRRYRLAAHVETCDLAQEARSQNHNTKNDSEHESMTRDYKA